MSSLSLSRIAFIKGTEWENFMLIGNDDTFVNRQKKFRHSLPRTSTD